MGIGGDRGSGAYNQACAPASGQACLGPRPHAHVCRAPASSACWGTGLPGPGCTCDGHQLHVQGVPQGAGAWGHPYSPAVHVVAPCRVVFQAPCSGIPRPGVFERWEGKGVRHIPAVPRV